MTPLPKRRWSTRRQGKKRATLKGRANTASKCGNCGFLKTSHTICPKCGYYRGKPALKIKEKKPKVENKE
jgi:large subunit ribosomal protein L32